MPAQLPAFFVYYHRCFKTTLALVCIRSFNWPDGTPPFNSW
mgnify:CR=1 FL=1